MKLIAKRNGVAAPLNLSATQCYCPSHVEEMLYKYADSTGNIECVFIDFSGENIPLISATEVRLASSMACAYHNALVRGNIQVM